MYIYVYKYSEILIFLYIILNVSILYVCINEEVVGYLKVYKKNKLKIIKYENK